MAGFQKFNEKYTETTLRHDKLISNDGVVFNISFDTFASYSSIFNKLTSDIVNFTDPIFIDTNEETLELFLDTFHRGPDNIKITEHIAYKIVMLSLQWDVFWDKCKELILNSKPDDKQLTMLYSNSILGELAHELVMKGVEFCIKPSVFDFTNALTYYKDRESYLVKRQSQMMHKIDFLEMVIEEEKHKREHAERKHKNLLNSRKRSKRI